MRSYYSHLDTFATAKNVLTKPTFRSSAIFPALKFKGFSSRILFMGYWILKRHIKEISAVVSLRSNEGHLLFRNAFLITDAKTYKIELDELLQGANITDETFVGSMEVEFFSSVNLFFPYPAVVINYYGDTFSTVVHTAQRVFNDFEDLKKNSETSVPESGFNIYVGEKQEPFFAIINGPEEVKNEKMEMHFYNSEKEKMSFTLALGNILPYQTLLIYPAEHCDLKNFLKEKVGAGKISFKVNWIFPRLVVGNINKALPALTITHTYYDCTNASKSSDYWLPKESKWHEASLIIPLLIDSNHFTKTYFYPIYSPSQFGIDVEIYDPQGCLLGKKENVLLVHSHDEILKWIDFKALCLELNIAPQPLLAARLIGHMHEDSKFPARVKLGLDIGVEAKRTLACNICTNLQPFNPAYEGKPSTFRWAPLLADQENCSLWMMNSSPEVEFKKEATCTLTFFREKDTQTLQRDVVIPPHGFMVIEPKKDRELALFFEGTIGWCTINASNPYLVTYYFNQNSSGVFGGDHGF